MTMKEFMDNYLTYEEEEKYIRNMVGYDFNEAYDGPPEHHIYMNFNWDETDEGSTYWVDIYWRIVREGKIIRDKFNIKKHKFV